MNCLVVTPHRFGIREMAEQVGSEWEALGHNIEYRLSKGSAARLGSFTIGVPKIAMWWYRNFRDIATNHERYDLIWTHQPLAPVLPTRGSSFWNKVIITIHTTLRREYELVCEGIYPQKLRPYYWFAKHVEARFHRRLTTLNAAGPCYTVVSPHLPEETSGFGVSEPSYSPMVCSSPHSTSSQSDLTMAFPRMQRWCSTSEA